uniref:Uncharacterized protein n=1 Tax=Mustela putorius furo TaxID=9669 RepID=M3Z5K3_MUSPF
RVGCVWLLCAERGRRAAAAGASEDHAGRAAALVAVGLRRVVHLPHDLCEQLVHRGFVFGRRLHEGAAPLLGQGLALAVRDLSLALQVHLVTHQDHGYTLVPLHADDLVPHGLDVLEALLVDEAIDEDEALAVLDVQVPHGRELLGARRVQDLQHRRRRVHFNLLAVEVLDGGVVLLDEGARHKLHGERGLAHAARAQYHHFVLSHGSVGALAAPAAAPSGLRAPEEAWVWRLGDFSSSSALREKPRRERLGSAGLRNHQTGGRGPGAGGRDGEGGGASLGRGSGAPQQSAAAAAGLAADREDNAGSLCEATVAALRCGRPGGRRGGGGGLRRWLLIARRTGTRVA